MKQKYLIGGADLLDVYLPEQQAPSPVDGATIIAWHGL